MFLWFGYQIGIKSTKQVFLSKIYSITVAFDNLLSITQNHHNNTKMSWKDISINNQQTWVYFILSITYIYIYFQRKAKYEHIAISKTTQMEYKKRNHYSFFIFLFLCTQHTINLAPLLIFPFFVFILHHIYILNIRHPTLHTIYVCLWQILQRKILSYMMFLVLFLCYWLCCVDDGCGYVFYVYCFPLLLIISTENLKMVMEKFYIHMLMYICIMYASESVVNSAPGSMLKCITEKGVYHTQNYYITSWV